MKDDNFINIPYSSENLDRYIIRTSILKAINWALPKLKGNLLDIGCGKMPYKEHIINDSNVLKYTGLDIEEALEYDSCIKPDIFWDGVKIPFDSNSFETAIATEVLEHCPEPELILKEIHRILKPEGVFFFTVPFLWNLHEVPNDEYRYTPFSLKRHLLDSGFINISIHATGGWHLAMAQMLGLWFRRSSIYKTSIFKKYLLSKVIMLMMKKLIKFGRYEKIEFKEGQMITGLYGVAYK